ncbi:MAG: hypothetical protein KBD63_08025 [Bacteriovoracaceae bacterium]|nr:hypothetical protein [Bacteriovoracaceae bacterium]
MRDIPSLPAAPLAEPLLKLINQGPSTSMLGIIKTILAEGRMKEVEKE